MRNPFVRLLVLAGALLIALGAATQTEPHAATSSAARLAQLDAISDYRAETWRWQALMSKPRTPTRYNERRTRDTSYLRWVRDLWRGRAARAERAAQNPPHRRQWLCIHRFDRRPAAGEASQPLHRHRPCSIAPGPRAAAAEGNGEPLDTCRADVGRGTRFRERARLLSVAEHGPLLRPDLGLVVAAGAAESLPQVDGQEDGRDREREQRLDDRAADPAVGDQPRDSSQSPPTV